MKKNLLITLLFLSIPVALLAQKTRSLNFNFGIQKNGFVTMEETTVFSNYDGEKIAEESSTLEYEKLNGYMFDMEIRRRRGFVTLFNFFWTEAQHCDKKDPVADLSKMDLEWENISDYPILDDIHLLGINILWGPTFFQKRRIQFPVLFGGGVTSLIAHENINPEHLSYIQGLYHITAKARLKFYLCRRLGIFGGISGVYTVASDDTDETYYWHFNPKITKITYEAGITITMGRNSKL